MGIRVSYILFDGDKKYDFPSEWEARQFWKFNRLSPMPELIRVETDVEALRRSVEESKKQNEEN